MTVTNAYATLEELMLVLGVRDTVDDTKATIALNGASRQIDAHCGRRFWQDSTVKVRTFRADDSTCCTVDDISTTTGLIVKIDDGYTGAFATTLTLTTHYVLEPLNAAAETPVWPYTEIVIVDGTGGYFPTSARPGVQVTAKFGWPAVPDDVKEACLIQAHMLFKAGDAALGGVQLGVDGNAFSVGEMHRTARGLLERYVRRTA